jgi:hypothetical protein
MCFADRVWVFVLQHEWRPENFSKQRAILSMNNTFTEFVFNGSPKAHDNKLRDRWDAWMVQGFTQFNDDCLVDPETNRPEKNTD